MSSNKHTAGPWGISDINKLTVVSHGEKFTFVCSTNTNNKNRQEMDIANARLIASAPTILEALQRILKDNEHLELNLESVELAEQAIKQATNG